MSESKYQIITFPSFQFNFINQNLSNYSLILIGGDLSKNAIEKELNAQFSNETFETNNIISIGLLKTENVSNFQKELSLIQQKIELRKSHFLVLLDYQKPTRYRSAANLPSEESFLVSPNYFIKLYSENIETGLCYHFMLQTLDSNLGMEQILVHQINHPNPSFGHLTNQPENAEVIIPHRGDLEDLTDLETALWYIKQQKVSPQKVSVCFDEFVSEQHFKIADEHQSVRFFVNTPDGVGPYPSRDKLARATEEDIIIFHDSDDVSTIDRVSNLTSELKNADLDAIGSHELRVNKIDKKIEAIRFPLDVIGVENKQEWHPIFFPTTAIKKSAYLKVGGLSTVRRHSSDSQFYWRAHFFLNIKNVDEFLYIRVKRENSLTTASSTALGTKVRERLRSQWRLDFLKIKNRNIGLLESTLVDEYNVADIDLISLDLANRAMILKYQELKAEMQKSSLSNNAVSPSFPKESDILEDRILDYKLVKDPGVAELKKSFSWRIGWSITRLIKLLFGWIPFVKKHL